MRFGNGTMYQTMSNLSAIILKKEKFPNGANIILLSIKNKGHECPNDIKSEESEESFLPKYAVLKEVSSGFIKQ